MAYIGNAPAEAYTNTVKDSFNGTGSATAFTLSQPTLTNDVRVVVENVVQDPAVAYNVSGTALTFTSAPPSGTDNIYVVHLGPAVMTTVPPAEIADATTFASSVSVQGAFTSLGIDDNAAATAVTIAASGKVGIGENSPDALLHVSGAGIPTIKLEDTDVAGGYAHFEVNGAALFIEAYDEDATAGTFVFKNATTEAMRISEAGRLGIGEPNADTRLHVTGGTTAGVHDVATFGGGSSGGASSTGDEARIILTTNPTNGNLRGAWISAENMSGGGQAHDMLFYTNSSFAVPQERMRIDSVGNVLMGGKTIDTVASTGVQLTADGKLWLSGTGNQAYLNRLGTGNLAAFFYGGSLKGSIAVSASATAYNTSSDYRLKEAWVPMTGASERVQALKPINFAWKVDGSRVDGFLAHEAQEVVPECATGTKDAMMDEEYEVTPVVLDADGAVVTEAVMGTRSVPDYQGIDQSKIVPLLTAALQEALNKIDDLETRLAAVEGSNP